MPAHLSLYLDAIRVVAALVVFLSHFSQGWLGGGLFWQAQAYAHNAVLVFFVLSGYVIAYAAATKETSLPSYAVARLSRIYSVAIPALGLSAALLLAGPALDPAHYAELARRGESYTQASVIGQLFAGLFFLSESWGIHIRVLSNTPYWSLAYEFWYYVIFGCLYFLRGRQRFLATTAACLIAGPKILLLAPIWLAGAAAWRWRDKFPPHLAWPIASATAFAFVVLSSDAVRKIAVASGGAWWPMEFRSTDHLLGFTIALHIAAIGAIAGKGFAMPKKLARIIQVSSSYTFSIYLFHFPLLVFFAALLPTPPGNPLRQAGLLVATSLAIYALAWLSEKKRLSLKTSLQRMLKPAYR